VRTRGGEKGDAPHEGKSGKEISGARHHLRRAGEKKTPRSVRGKELRTSLLRNLPQTFIEAGKNKKRKTGAVGNHKTERAPRRGTRK